MPQNLLLAAAGLLPLLQAGEAVMPIRSATSGEVPYQQLAAAVAAASQR